MANEYKLAKEAWVSNLDGGKIIEINLVSAVAPAAVLLWSALQAKQSLFTPYTLLACGVDFLLNCAAILYATTLFSSNLVLLNFLLVVPAIVVLLLPGTKSPNSLQPRKPPARQVTSISDMDTDPLPVKPFITHYRGTMLVITCAAILAVDFPVFPRRFAKVENWGTSLMDLGVGLFVFSAGVVAARPIMKQKLASQPQSLILRLKTAIRHALPLMVLGFVRLYSVKGLDYAEHVTEYGVHWNFFFTLALIPPLVAIFDTAFQYVPSYGFLGIVVGVAYQIVLDSTSLKAFILTAPRTDLLSKNREGIFSSIGYLAIFLSGQGAGMIVLPREASSRNPLNNKLFRKLAVWCSLWCTLFFVCNDHRFASVSVSRRMANLTYVLWVAAFSSCQIMLFYVIEVLLFPNLYDAKMTKDAAIRKRGEASSHVLRCFNRNGLAIFLLANLLTGLVNLTLPTITMSDISAMAVLIVYMGSVAGVALLLDHLNVSIKL